MTVLQRNITIFALTEICQHRHGENTGQKRIALIGGLRQFVCRKKQLCVVAELHGILTLVFSGDELSCYELFKCFAFLKILAGYIVADVCDFAVDMHEPELIVYILERQFADILVA